MRANDGLAADRGGVLSEQVTLANDAQVWVRPLGAGDEQSIRDLLMALDPISWYLRFLSPYSTALDAIVRLLARVEGEWGLTMVAEQPLDGANRIIGIANVAFMQGDAAELGVLIPYAWQKQRLGTELAVRALHGAERRGVSRFVGYMAAHNVAARRLLSKIGVVRSVRFAGRVAEYWFSLQQLPQAHGIVRGVGSSAGTSLSAEV